MISLVPPKSRQVGGGGLGGRGAGHIGGWPSWPWRGPCPPRAGAPEDLTRHWQGQRGTT